MEPTESRTHRLIPRGPLLITILLLFGTVLHIALALACAYLIPRERTAESWAPIRMHWPTSRSPAVEDENGLQLEFKTFGVTDVVTVNIGALPFHMDATEFTEALDTSPGFELNDPGGPFFRKRSFMTCVHHVEAGWPFRSLYGARLYEGSAAPNTLDPDADATPWWVFSTLRSIDSVAMLRLLPICPRPLGFLANSAAWAAALWMLLFGITTIRAIIRLARGRCPACGYPGGASDRCTECGRPRRRATPMPRSDHSV